jgi:hypothetical protein
MCLDFPMMVYTHLNIKMPPSVTGFKYYLKCLLLQLQLAMKLPLERE